MKSNRARNTSPELQLRRALTRSGVRGYRLHKKGVPGRPDIVFPRSKVAIFVNGCFWHRCPKCDLPLPKSHAAFWKRKFELNKQRDKRKMEALVSEGWCVLTIWECEIRDDLRSCVMRIKRAL